jgi:hypothetical protein
MKARLTVMLALALTSATASLPARADDGGADASLDGGDGDGGDAGDGAAMGTLLVLIDSSGSGVVTSAPAGIDCGKTCFASYPLGASVTLTATPDPDSTFAGWFGGACSGTAPCTLTIEGMTSIVGSFATRTGASDAGVGADSGALDAGATTDAGGAATTRELSGGGGGCDAAPPGSGTGLGAGVLLAAALLLLRRTRRARR